MVNLQQGQSVAERDDLVVYESTGEYNDADMVICALAETPAEPYCRLEAQFIAYGGLVYAISDEKQLLEEVQKIDPETTLAEETLDSAVGKQPEVLESVQQKSEPAEQPVIDSEKSPSPVDDPVKSPDPVIDTNQSVTSTEPVISNPSAEIIPNTDSETVTQIVSSDEIAPESPLEIIKGLVQEAGLTGDSQ